MRVNNPAGPQDPGSSRGVWRSAPHPKPLPLRTSAKSRDVCHSPRAHCRDGEARCSQAGLSFNISNLLQLFTSTAKSQRKLILQRACLCKLCRSSNINSMILAYNFSNLMFSWPRTSPRNWRWKQLQKAWPTAQHSLKRSQRGRRSQPCGQASTPSLQLTPTRPMDSGQASALHWYTASCSVLLRAQGYQQRCTAKLVERQNKCENHLRVTNIPNLILLLVKPGPKLWIFRTKCSPSCYNT